MTLNTPSQSSGQRIAVSVGSKEIIFESGHWAKQAAGSVTVRLGDTMVLVACAGSRQPRAGIDFLPLTVDYRERTYAAGRIPGGFFKREGKQRENEVLSSRLADRSIRPLFPEGLSNDIQVQILVISHDTLNDADILGINGASCALMVSDIPFHGPVGAVRIGRREGEFLINPTIEEQQSSEMDLVVAGKKDCVMMVECGAEELPESLLLEALDIAQIEIAKICQAQEELAAKVGRKKYEWTAKALPAAAQSALEAFAKPKAREAILSQSKQERGEAFDILKRETVEHLKESAPGEDVLIKTGVDNILYDEIRNLILNESIRADGRKLDQIRKITCETDVLPRTHGSALFTRGQTQALVTVTLGMPQDKQIMDNLEGEYKERFMLHYNFPSFATGEVKPDRGPGRREIGHGALAKRALCTLLPDEETFPYTVRVVSEILESNGSSSMASVCGGSLALFDAGVPTGSAVAGIAMGLITEPKGSRFAVLSDIMGLEDHFGDMDFKVAGTREGVTALQMDIKIQGISREVMAKALEQARTGRLHILDIMNEAMSAPKAEISTHAPRIVTVVIPQDKIGALIGPGGKNIRRIIEETGADVEVEDDGRVFVSGTDSRAVQAAKEMVESCTAQAEVGKIYKGRVVDIKEFGAFVEIFPGKDGLLHISQIADYRVAKVEDVLQVGDEVEVKVLEVDSQGKVKLSRKAVLRPGSELENVKPDRDRRPPRMDMSGRGPKRHFPS